MGRWTSAEEDGQDKPQPQALLPAYDTIKKRPTPNGQTVGQRLDRTIGGYSKKSVEALVLDLLAENASLSRQRKAAIEDVGVAKSARTAAEQRVENLLSGSDTDWVVEDAIKDKLEEAQRQAEWIVSSARAEAESVRESAYERTAEMQRREKEQQAQLETDRAAALAEVEDREQELHEANLAELDAESVQREKRNAADLAIIHRQRKDFLSMVTRMEAKFRNVAKEFGQGEGFFQTFSAETKNLIRQQEEESPELRGERPAVAQFSTPDEDGEDNSSEEDQNQVEARQ